VGVAAAALLGPQPAGIAARQHSRSRGCGSARQPGSHLPQVLLAALDPEEQQHLKEAAGSDEALVLRSSFPLSPAAQTLIADAAGRVVDRAVAIDFREDPGLECGVELAIGSRHVGWTLGAHLDALETDVARLLNGRADAKADA
jgi:hypothetical protein